MVPPIRLTDDIITLRPFEAADASRMYVAVRESLADLKPWMSWVHDNYSERETREWIIAVRSRWNDGTHYGFAITDAEDGSFLGGCSLSHIHPVYHFCNLGYWVRSSQRGKGYAARAARLAARFAFERIGLIRVEIVIAAGNESSIKVAEKSGAHREGILLNRMVIHKRVSDAVMFSLLPSDFGLAAEL